MRASTLFGRLAYAASIIVFGVQYLIYARGMAGPVVGPPWITGRTMWAYLVGLGCIAAGVSIAANLKMTVAARAADEKSHFFTSDLLLIMVTFANTTARARLPGSRPLELPVPLSTTPVRRRVLPILQIPCGRRVT